MKKLFILLLISTVGFAQTSFSDDDIDAAAGNQYETLLTNVEQGYNSSKIQAYLQKIGMTYSDDKEVRDKNTFTYRFEKQIISGDEKQGYVYVKLYEKKMAGYNHPMTTKIEIWGDKWKVIEFFIGYWSRKVNLEDVKSGEVATTRFLTDVASISFLDEETAKITVVTAKDR